MEAFATAIVNTFEDCWCVMKFCACLFLLFAAVVDAGGEVRQKQGGIRPEDQ